MLIGTYHSIVHIKSSFVKRLNSPLAWTSRYKGPRRGPTLLSDDVCRDVYDDVNVPLEALLGEQLSSQIYVWLSRGPYEHEEDEDEERTINMLSRVDTIAVVAEKVAHHMFVMMLNPEYRGSKFNFATFDIEKHEEASAGLSFLRPLNVYEMQRHRELARLAWDGLVEKSGVLTWIATQTVKEVA